MSINIKNFIDKIKTLNNANNLPKSLKVAILTDINTFFPNLNNFHTNMLKELSIYLTNTIKRKFLTSIRNEKDLVRQLTMNNSRDIKAIILMLLPFIDDKENNKKYKLITDLNQIIYNVQNASDINKNILEKDINDTLKKEFLITNFGIGLIYTEDKEGNILTIRRGNNSIIDEIIYHNFIGLLETLKTTTGKLYVNWINTVPISEEDFEDEPIFKNTIEQFEDMVFDQLNFQLEYDGIWIGDLYNVFRKGYYQNVKKVKWLIFNTNQKYNIQYLDEYLNLKNHLEDKYKTYIDLPIEDQIKFKNNFETMLSQMINDKNIENIVKNIFVFLANNYSYRNELLVSLAKSNNNIMKKFKLTEEDEEDNDMEFNATDSNKINNITINDIRTFYNSIDISDVWRFIKETIDTFKNTIYSTFIIKDDDTIDKDFYYIKLKKQGKDVDSKINLKNMYNIAKTISHFNRIRNQWDLLAENYIGLDILVKNDFIDKFIDGDINNWLNINKNLRTETNNGDINSRKLEINQGWQELKYYFVFYYLIRKGLLSKFVPDFGITDKKSLPSGYASKNKRKTELLKEKFDKKENKKWLNCYYYLTDQKYSKLKKIRQPNKNIKIKEYTYFDLIAKKQYWYGFYAMDWLTQINFFHTYIYHQVIYVTGATGQGKSTQVPKLLLYALKMIDYKDNGRIVCTQPRIGPTTGNSTRIAEELGVPIEQPSYTSNEKIRTDNFYCQYKYSEDSHIKANTSHLSLKMVTDGSLYTEIRKNIVMKEIAPEKNKENVIFTSNNLYDIIIVDEAHEHNRNMDLILTLARSSCYYNNSLRLIIVSATMDDDEPIYRSYFKIINEQIMYPIKKVILDPFLDDDVLPLSLYMDRRFHISPPGETTQYVITENYMNLPENGSDLENSIEAQNKAYEVVIDICKRSSKGEILLFSTGQREIIEAVEYLNKNLPAGNIALPYFSAMNQKYKDIVEKIRDNIGKIKNQRENIYKEWGSEFIEDKSVINGIYKRSIIVATNVAEASITIDGLEYVVDNGYSKESNFGKLEVEKISEASRLQRKGRVGRLADGTVYYMYKKGARANVKPKYNINQEEMTSIFSDLATKKDQDWNNEIFSKYYDPHIYEWFYQYYRRSPVYNDLKDIDLWRNLYLEEWNKTFGISVAQINKKLLESETVKTKISKNIIDKQYNIWKDILLDINPNNLKEFTQKWNYLKYKYYPKPYYLDISNNRKSYLSVYQDGYILEQLFDADGHFYLIHPKENKIIRNCNGEIIKYKFNEYKEPIKVNKLDQRVFQGMLRESEIKLQLVNLENNSKNDEISSLNFKKTLLSEKISDLRAALTDNTLSEEDLMTILYSYGNEVLDETILILALIKTCRGSLKRLATYILSKKGAPIFNFMELKQLFPSEKSDIESIYKITQKIKKYFSMLKLFRLDEKDTIYNNAKFQYNELVNKFKNAIKENKNRLDPPKSLAAEWDMLNKIRNEGKLDDDSGFMKWLDKSNYIRKEISKDCNKYKVNIYQFCEANYLDVDVIFSFFEKYLDYKLSIKTVDKNQDMKVKEKNVFEWFDIFKNNFISFYGDMNIVDKIIQSFIFGYATNTAIKFDPNKDYQIISDINNQERHIQPLFPGSEDNETFLTKINNVVVYYTEDTRYDTIKIITNANPKNLIDAHPLYFNKKFFKNIIILKDEETRLAKIFEFNGPYFERFLDEIKKNRLTSKIVFQAYDGDENSENNDTNLNEYINYMRKKLI